MLGAQPGGDAESWLDWSPATLHIRYSLSTGPEYWTLIQWVECGRRQPKGKRGAKVAFSWRDELRALASTLPRRTMKIPYGSLAVQAQRHGLH